MNETIIEVSKCHSADYEALYDEAGEFALNMCKRCKQECQLVKVCADCEGTGLITEWLAPDDYRKVSCLCQESKAEREADNLIMMALGK